VILSVSVSHRQSLFTVQPNTLPYSCPSVPVGVKLSYLFLFHTVSMYSQPILTTYRTAVRMCLSVYSCHIKLIFTPSVYSQPNLTPYRTAVRLCLSVYCYLINFSSLRQSVFTAQSNTIPCSFPLVPVGVQLSYQFQFQAVSLYSQAN